MWRKQENEREEEETKNNNNNRREKSHKAMRTEKQSSFPNTSDINSRELKSHLHIAVNAFLTVNVAAYFERSFEFKENRLREEYVARSGEHD